MKTKQSGRRRLWTFETAKELSEFVREFEEQPDKTLDVSYFKLIAVLRPKEKNKNIALEWVNYLYRRMGLQDSLSLMRLAEKRQHPSDTEWMLKVPIISTIKTKRRETK